MLAKDDDGLSERGDGDDDEDDGVDVPVPVRDCEFGCNEAVISDTAKPDADDERGMGWCDTLEEEKVNLDGVE